MSVARREKDVVVRNLADIEPIADTCGEIRVLTSREDFEKANAALVIINAPATPHYHKVVTEFYFIIEGKGRLIVGHDTYQIKDGTLIIIPPNTAHYLIPRKVTKVLVFCVPSWSQADEIVLQENDLTADYSANKEKFELIDEILSRGDLGFEEEMSRKEREDLDIERQTLVLRVGWNRMSISELRELLRIA